MSRRPNPNLAAHSQLHNSLNFHEDSILPRARCMFQRLKLAVLFLAFVAAIGIVGTSHVAHTGANNEEVALSLATLLRSARAVISDNQKHINDASKGDKGLSSQVVLAKAKANYKKATGVDIGSIDGASLQGELLKTAIDSIVEVMDEAQSLINKEGVSFKGFLPVVFARLVIEKFRARKGAIADLKLTAPKQYVRNRANRPDAWEHDIIENQFKSGSHAKGTPVSAMSDKGGKPAFRLILSEYITRRPASAVTANPRANWT